MEIPSGMSLGQAMLKQQISISVQKLAMDTTAQNTDELRKMLEQSVNPSVGANIDFQV